MARKNALSEEQLLGRRPAIFAISPFGEKQLSIFPIGSPWGGGGVVRESGDPTVLLLFSQRWRHHQPVRVALEVFKVIIQDQLKHTR